MKNKNEIWKPIKGYKKLYQVSNFGNIKSLERWVIYSNGAKQFYKERILKPILGNHGYYYVNLYKNKKHKVRTIHQLVVIAFLNHKPDGYNWVINHIDFNPLNNHLDNLEIVTARENCNRKHIKHSSKYTGVTWNKQGKKWQAQITFNGKRIYLGLFTKQKQAAKAYKKFKKINNI